MPTLDAVPRHWPHEDRFLTARFVWSAEPKGRLAHGSLLDPASRARRGDGLAGGIVLGALAGAVLIAVTTPATPLLQVVALPAVGIAIGAPLGAYIGFERAGTHSDAWSTTFEDLGGGAIWLGVNVRDLYERERARRTLEHQHPAELRER
jgi:hypothetical protein